MMPARPPVVALFPEASFGAALNCVGIAQELKKRGAEPVFITHAGFSGVFSEYGFQEYPVPVAAGITDAETRNYWQEFLNRHIPHFNLPPSGQIETYVTPVWQAIVDSVMAVEPGLRELLAKIAPDVIVLDNVIMFPAIARSARPWVRVISCAETELPDPAIPPYLSGLANGDPAAFAPFRARYLDAVAPIQRQYNRFRGRCGLPALPEGEFLESSPWMNLLLAPQIVRRERAQALPEHRFRFLDGCVRREGPFEVPVLPRNDGPLVYVSFGSLGAMDTGLFKRLIGVFATLPARFLLNVGGSINAYAQVPDNVYLDEWYPQPSVVRQCDLFIHHGGNNSFCEALYFGIPSLVIPYCWDGHDNATRAGECAVGQRLRRDSWTDAELAGAIRDLLADKAMSDRLKRNSERMRGAQGAALAADLILKAATMPGESGPAR
jgi:MGT family glycosyltransferase